MLRRFAAAMALWFVPAISVAQVIPPGAQPGRERERFIEPRPPQVQPGASVISLPSTVAPPGAERVKLIIRQVQIRGSTIYSDEELKPLYAEFLRQQVSLLTVYEIARRITAKYGADGYVLSRAIVPPQQLNPKGAVVRIEVVEGYIDKVIWPKTLARYRDFFSEYAAKITAERPINIRTLERYLLLASDLPGLKFSTALKASEQASGASTLIVEVVEKPVEATARADNRGTQSRGPYQFLTSATFNSMFGQHDAVTLAYAGVTRLKQLQYVAPAYRWVLTSEGLTAFANGTYSWGKPGTAALEALDFTTRSTIAEAGLSYPIIRARERNLTVAGLAFLSNNYSDVLGAPFNVDRLRGARVRADADIADSAQGINQVNVTYSQGIQGLGSTDNGNPLASRAAGRVDFSKLEATLSRTQPLAGGVSAFVSAYALYGFTPLLVSEQCGYGGRFFGRAFDPSTLLGDRCWQTLGELRYDVAPPVGAPLSQFQLYTFADYGKLYTISPSAGTAASTSAASVGSGVRLGGSHVHIDLTAAKGIEGPRNDWRFFFAVMARN